METTMHKNRGEGVDWSWLFLPDVSRRRRRWSWLAQCDLFIGTNGISSTTGEDQVFSQTAGIRQPVEQRFLRCTSQCCGVTTQANVVTWRCGGRSVHGCR